MSLGVSVIDIIQHPAGNTAKGDQNPAYVQVIYSAMCHSSSASRNPSLLLRNLQIPIRLRT